MAMYPRQWNPNQLVWLLQPHDVIEVDGITYTVDQVLKSNIPGAVPKVLGYVTDIRSKQSDGANLPEPTTP